MFKTKIKHKSSYFLVALMLAIFVVGSSFSLVHSFSHNDFLNSKIEKNQPLKKHESDNCALCFSASFQNQILFSASLIFAAIAFRLSFFLRIFDRIKFSYLFSSHLSQAPPALS